MSWEKVKLGELLSYEQPTKYIVSKEEYDDRNSIPVLTAGKSFILGYTNEEFGVYDNLPAIIFDDFTTASKYVDFPFKVKSSAMKILTTDASKANIRFMYYLLQTLNIEAGQHKRYWISKFAEYEVKVPPLEEQNRIVKILDKADALRQKDQLLLQKYDELAQSIFYDMFGDPVKNEKGWEVKKLEHSVVIKPDSILPENSQDYCYIGLEHIEKDTGNILKQSQSDEVLKSNKFKFDSSHILYGKLRPYLNKVALPNFSGICSTDIFPISCKDNADKYFISFILKSKHFVEHATVSSVGANLPRANKDTIYNYETICPPLEIQKEFSKKLNNIISQKEIIKNTTLMNDSLFTSLINKYFSN